MNDRTGARTPGSPAAAWRTWHLPLSRGDITLGEAHGSLDTAGMKQREVPLIVQLVENPRYDLPGIDIFSGATYLREHDYLHILLGRGLLPKDEAFVLGFTMGSSNRVSEIEERLFTLIARYLYPKGYRFDDEDVAVYKDAVRLGYVSDCNPLAQVNCAAMLDWPISRIRRTIGLEEDLLRAYYAIEARRYPKSIESQRLLA
jgi:hypothetical protein